MNQYRAKYFVRRHLKANSELDQDDEISDHDMNLELPDLPVETRNKRNLCATK